MVNVSVTPIRRLEGITYWVIDEPAAIHDFINKEIRKEWQTDARSEHRNPKDDPWLKTLLQRTWRLETMKISQIKLNPDIMNYVDSARGYVFSESLKRRTLELQWSMKLGGLVLSPLVVRGEDKQLKDGYCRYTTLKSIGVARTYAYLGTF